MARLHPLLEPFVPSEVDPFDATRAAHLLHRAGFGGTLEEIEQTRKLGPQAAVERMLDFPDNAVDDVGGDTPDLSMIAGYPRTFAERRKLYQGKSADERMEINNQLMRSNREAVRATVEWWLGRMVNGPYPLQEKLTLFWHGHFTTSAREERSAWLMWGQNETLRRYAAGNFRTFVKQISRDPAMLDYLNNQQNRKGSPNENYARELMELFTLGIGAYTEADIKEAARAFTGWGHDGETFLFRKSLHDDDEKLFFGVRGNFDGDDVIDLILRRRECAEYIATRLFQYFAYDKPEPGLTQSLGNVLREANYELRPLLYMIFTSKAFYSRAAIGTQIKSPVHLVTSAARQMKLDTVTRGGVLQSLDQMGQMPLSPPNVKGWPGGRTWINTSTLFVRYNTAITLVGRIEAGELIPPGTGATDAAAIVQHWLDRLIQRPIAEEKQVLLVKSLQTSLAAAAAAATDRPADRNRRPGAQRPGNNSNPREAVRRMIELIVSMPEYQLC